MTGTPQVTDPRCPRCGATRPMHPRWAVCHPCAAECGWDPHCEACRLEARGLPLGDLEHGTACLDGWIARRATVTVLTDAEAAEWTRRRETLSLECAAATPRCAGCDSAAAEGWGPCLHDCHEQGIDPPHRYDPHGDCTDLIADARAGGWIAGVRWAAAEADAQAAGREPVFILDVTDHLRACASDPDRGSAVPRSEAPEHYASDEQDGGAR